MAYNAGILLGRITKISGFEGAVTIKTESFFSGNIPQMESVYLEIEGRPVPFFISGEENAGAGLLRLRFDGYPTAESVSGFVGCRVYLTTATETIETNDDLSLLEGFTVVDRDGQVLGMITEVIPNPGQWLLGVKTGSGKQLLIPLHEDLIVKSDRRKKRLVMDLPAGLGEIN